MKLYINLRCFCAKNKAVVKPQVYQMKMHVVSIAQCS